MKLILSYTSGQDFLRHMRAGGNVAVRPSKLRGASDGVGTKEALARFALPDFPLTDGVLHVLVARKGATSGARNIRSHLCTIALPEGSFWLAGSGVYAPTPELCFLQMARELPAVEAALFGMELCGLYTHLPGGRDGFAPAWQETTVKKLAAYVAKCGSAPGAAKARRALSRVADGAASPMESRLTLLLCLPVCRGGYGLPMPDMNAEVSVKANAAMPVQSLHCDLHWRAARVTCEYNSSQYHAGQASRDAARQNALTAEGQRVFTVTPGVVADEQAMDAVASQLARALGKRQRTQPPGGERERLRRALFPWAFDDRWTGLSA